MDGSRELKSKFHGLWGLKRLHESHKIQRLILLITHRVLQNWGVNYFELCIRRKIVFMP